MNIATAAPDDFDPEIKALMAMTPDERAAELVQLIGQTARNFARLAKVVHVMESCGQDLSAFRLNGMVYWLRLVATGKALPELLVRFANNPALLNKMLLLPIDEQRHLADGGRIPLMVLQGGIVSTIQADPFEMTPRQVQQAFHRHHIRPISEQRLWIEEERGKAALPAPERIGPFKPDPERAGATFAGKRGDFISLADLEAVVRALKKKALAPTA